MNDKRQPDDARKRASGSTATCSAAGWPTGPRASCRSPATRRTGATSASCCPTPPSIVLSLHARAVRLRDAAVRQRRAAARGRCRSRSRECSATRTTSACSRSRISATSRCRRISAPRTPAEHAALYRQAVALDRDAAAPRRGARVVRVPAVRHRVRRREAHVGDGLLHQALPRGLPRRRLRRARRATRCAPSSRELVETLAAEPRVLCHRDYHSRNLMLHDERLYIIDFQDARMGPDTYDLVSLLRDSYVDLPEQTVDELIAYFLALKGQTGRADEAFRRRFDLMALQRNLKALGTFGYQTTARRNPVYIQYIPRTLRYVRDEPRQPARSSAGCATCSPRTSRSSGSRSHHGDSLGRAYNGWFRLRTIHNMRFGISTHLYHDQRLEPRAPGADRRRTASRRSSCSPRARTSTTTTRRRSRSSAQWLNETGLTLHSIHAPITRRLRRTAMGRDASRPRRADNARAAGAVRESRSGARDRARDPGRASWSCTSARPRQGVPPGDNSRAAASRSLEEICRLAEPLGVRVGARGDPERSVARAGAGDDARAGLRGRRRWASAWTSATRT